MPAPMVIAAGIMGGASILTGLANFWQAEKARGAAEDQLRKIEALFEQIKPPDLNIEISDPPELIAQLPELPDFDLDPIQKEQIRQLAEYQPEFYDYIPLEAAQTISDTEVGLEGRDAQLDALRELSGIVETGYDPAFDAKVQLAAQRGQSEAQSRTQSILQDMARRGMLGSGIQAALMQQQASDSMADYSDNMLEAAIASRDNEMSALRDLATIGGRVRGTELDLQRANTDILNRFNELNRTNLQNYEIDRANMANKAQMYNIGEQQRIAEQNIADTRADAIRNQEYINKMRGDIYGAQSDAVKYQNQIQQQAWQNKRAAEDALIGQRQQDFRNQMDIAAGKGGIYQQRAQNEIGKGQDRISAAQGLGEGIGQAGMMYGRFAPTGNQYTSEQGSWSQVGQGQQPQQSFSQVSAPIPFQSAPIQQGYEPGIYEDEYYRDELYR